MKFAQQLILISFLALGLIQSSYATTNYYLPELESLTLAPQIRLETGTTIYSMSSDTIVTYLENVLIFDDRDQYETLPYIVGFDRNAKIGGPGDRAYTRGLNMKNDLSEYTLLQPGAILKHPDTQEDLGLQAFTVGKALVQEFGPTQTVLITDAVTSMEVNTRLVPLVGIDLPGQIDVKYPPMKLDGYVLGVQNNRNIAGDYNSVVISLGERDGLKQGNILDLTEGIREVNDPNTDHIVDLPEAKIGEVLIFTVRKKISLGLITYTRREIVLGDRVTVPIYNTQESVPVPLSKTSKLLPAPRLTSQVGCQSGCE